MEKLITFDDVLLVPGNLLFYRDVDVSSFLTNEIKLNTPIPAQDGYCDRSRMAIAIARRRNWDHS